MDGKIILITGAAGTGKSTLAHSLEQSAWPFRRIDYGQLLLEYESRQRGYELTYEEMRRESAAVITPGDVAAVDAWLIEQLPAWRTETNVIIDSHPVTKESFGFRVTPFSAHQVACIAFNVILVLVGDPEELSVRIGGNPQGRPVVTTFQASFQVQLQAAVATLYAITCARPCFAVDTTELDENQVLEVTLNLLRRSGMSFQYSANSPKADTQQSFW